MRAPLSWLRDYAPLDAPIERLVEALGEIGLVVESADTVGEGIADVVVARVADIRRHPDADRIRIVDVDAGDGKPLQIICGAWNFDVGDLVPLAPVGAILPGDFKISKRKMRGEESNGMLCSATELDLPHPGGADGLLVLAPGSTEPGTPLGEALGVYPDVVFDLDVTPNRPDALCMAGIARDLAAALGEQWSWPSGAPAGDADPDVAVAPLTVREAGVCQRFVATVIEGVPSGPSPAWMGRRLTLAGMRPISGVVDVSNYVMLDVGQPNHAYDLDRLGGGGLSVRQGRSGETVRTLDGVTREVGPSDCLICDAEDGPVGIAGVMGAASAEVDKATTRVLLECAYFDPTAIARTGKRLGLASEARTRFERGVDPEAAGRATQRFVGLLRLLRGGDAVRFGRSGEFRDDAGLPRAPVISLRTARVNALLGTKLGDADVDGLLTPLGFTVERSVPGAAKVTVPTWRLECSREIDLVEEVARMWGYGRIERTMPPFHKRSGAPRSETAVQRHRVRQLLCGAGFDEAWTPTFLAPDDLGRSGLDGEAVEVQNPLDASESILRPSLLPGLLKALRFNVDRQSADLAFFEVGRVFAMPGAGSTLPFEEERLGVAVLAPREAVQEAALEAGVRTWVLLAESLRLSAPSLVAGQVAGLHPGRSAVLSCSGTVVGSVGEVAGEVASAYGLPGRVGWLEISLDALVEVPRAGLGAREVSRYPAADIDLAFVVPTRVAASDLVGVLRSAADVTEDVTLFDVYRSETLGEANRGLTFRVRLRAPDRTLRDDEIAALRRAMIDAAGNLGAVLRS